MRVTLRDYAKQYVKKVDGSEGYGRQFQWLANALEKMLGRAPVYVDELTTDLINQMVQSWKAANRSSTTIRSRRNMLYRLARVASRDDGLATKPPKPVRDDLDQIKRRFKVVNGYASTEVAKLLTSVRKSRGFLRVHKVPIAGVELPNGAPWVRKGIYFVSYIFAVWDTGFRLSDMLLIRLSDIGPDGNISIVQHKTGKPILGNFRPWTMDAIRESFELSPNREFVWPLWSSRGTFFRMRKRVLKRAGLSGGMSRLRHSAGTACELLNPGSGPAFLGNSPEVFYRHYFDRRQMKVFSQPPPLPLGTAPAPTDSAPSEPGDMAELLRKAIRDSGQRISAISRATGIHKMTISDFMRGVDMGISRAGKIASYLGLRLGA